MIDLNQQVNIGEIENLLQLGWGSTRTETEEAIEIGRRVEKIASENNDELNLARSWILLSNCYNVMAKYAEGLELASKAYEIIEKHQDLEWQIRANRELGYIYNNMGNLETAITYYQKGLQLIKLANREPDPLYLNNLGVVYYNLGQMEQSLQYFKEALNFAENKDSHMSALLLSNIADAYLTQKEVELALKFNQKAYDILQDGKPHLMYLAQCHNIFGLIYKEMKDWEFSFYHFNLALNTFEKNNQPYYVASMNHEMGCLFFEQKEYSQAINYLLVGLQKAEKIAADGIQKDVCFMLSETYKEIKDFENAFFYLKRFHDLHAKMQTTELNNKLTQHMAETKVEKALQDAEIERLKNIELERQKEEAALKATMYEKSYEDIKIIGEIGQQITSILDTEQLLNVVYTRIKELMDVDIYGICMYHENVREIEFPAFVEQGISLQLDRDSVDNENRLAARCIKYNQKIIVDGSEEQLNFEYKNGGVTGDKALSILYYPLTIENNVIGALTVQSYRINAYSERDLEMINALASFIAIAVNNSKQSEELKLKTMQLELLSVTDALTGLFNVRYMREKLEGEFVKFQRKATPFSIAVLDIDFFKMVNDVHGHAGGDFVLQEISKMFNKYLRKQDVVARWGGEEFLILLPDTTQKSAHIVCERIREAIENTSIMFNEKIINLTSTFGIAEFNGESVCINSVIDRADQALYIGKKSGRNRVVLYDKNNYSNMN